jgi:hypothetical protein
MNGMKSPNISIWRKRIGMISALLGILLFAPLRLVYLTDSRGAKWG